MSDENLRKKGSEPTEEKSERKYQVFISSTFLDLHVQRETVLKVIVDHRHLPIALQRFPAEDDAIPDVIRRAIEACQIYIIILGHRYGEIVKGRRISFSHLEFEIAHKSHKIIIPFLLDGAEVRENREAMQKDLDNKKMEASKLARGTLGRKYIDGRISELKTELKNEDKLWKFRKIVQKKLFQKIFSHKPNGKAQQFDGQMVLEALVAAEKKAAEKQIPGWIREPEKSKLAEALNAISKNRFLEDVVGVMAKFDLLEPRIRDQADEKDAAAEFFADTYFRPLLRYKTALFFESGSTIAYVAQEIGKRLQGQQKDIHLVTNNVLAYLIFWLVHRVRCSLFPWGPPEQLYGAVLGPIIGDIPETKRPSFPPEPLNKEDKDVIDLLCSEKFGPNNWRENREKVLLLGALSGLQLDEDGEIANCLGPHVGSFQNKIFKRFMYETKLPLMLFMAAHKINSDTNKVNKDRCHFILDQRNSKPCDRNLSWENFCKERPVAFCVGCKNEQPEMDKAMHRFKEFGFQIHSTGHKSAHTAFVARNQKFIEEFENGMNIS